VKPLVEELEGLLGGRTGIDAHAEAERIVRAALEPGEAGAGARARALAAQRLSGVPLAYVTGRQAFLGIELLAAPGALVPREETELLGRTALEAVRARGNERPLLVDMCCGSGNLACALAVHLPAAVVWASDLTDDCVSLARRNVAHLGLQDRVRVVQGDLFAGLAGAGLEGRVDAIVCNPPYISGTRLAADRASLLEHEPREAFDGGPYGLSIHQRVVKEALPYLREGGDLLFEFGLGQDRQLVFVFARARAYEDAQLVANQAGEPRVAHARRRAIGS
jgi:release factor glutamine methyltransferase